MGAVDEAWGSQGLINWSRAVSMVLFGNCARVVCAISRGGRCAWPGKAAGGVLVAQTEEIAVGRLAAQRATIAPIRQAARTIASDHQQVLSKLQELARNLRVTLRCASPMWLMGWP